MNDTVERRFTLLRVDARASQDTRTIGGYAAVFNSPSQNLGGFREVIAPSAFNRAASKGWQGFDGDGVRALFNHDDSQIIGRSGVNVKLDVDGEGLRYSVDLLGDSLSERVLELVRSGIVQKSSFAFIVDPDGDDWGTDETGFPVRTVTQTRLGDVSPVTSPAYLDSSVGLRSLARKFDADPDEVKSLAAAGELRRFFVRTDATVPVKAGETSKRLAAHLSTKHN